MPGRFGRRFLLCSFDRRPLSPLELSRCVLGLPLYVLLGALVRGARVRKSPTTTDADLRKRSTSSHVNLRHCPGRRFPRVRSPTAMRLSCCTLWPRDASILRISRLRPSSSTISNTVLCLCCERTATLFACTVASARLIPCRSDSIVSAVGIPAI